MPNPSAASARVQQSVKTFLRGDCRWGVFCEPAWLAEEADSLLENLSIPAMQSNEAFDLVDVTSQNNLVVIVSVTSIPQPGTISIRALPVPELEDDFRYSWVDQLQATRDSHKRLVDWAGELVPGAQGWGRTLLIKVRDAQRWFLKFPISSFARLKLGEFAKYDHVHWVLSERTFSETVEKRRELLRLLSNTAALLDGTVVLINKYRKQVEGAEGSALTEGLQLIEELVSQYQSVWTEEGIFTLRSIVSPSREELTEVLCNPRTKIVLGAFEADTGDWQLSDWRHAVSAKEYFKVENLAGRLRHIVLLRIFHCNALDPEDGNRTIVTRLLDSGAHIIEGGVTEESYFEFQDAVFRFFFRTPLYYTLEMRDFNGEFSLRDFAARCNRFLARNGFPEINTEGA
jgi:hypothetical protein